MRIRSLRTLCAAAVTLAMAIPAVAQQDTPTAEGATRQSPNAARGAEGEAGTVQPGTTTQPRTGVQPGATLQPGQVRPGLPQGGVIIEERVIEETEVQPGQRTTNYPPGQRQAQGRIDNASLARYIAASNEAEIRVNEFARQQAQSDEVKKFAEKMVQEHTQFGQKLRDAAGAGGTSQPGATGRSATTSEERTTRRNIRDESARENQDDATQNRQQRQDQTRSQPGTQAEGTARQSETDRATTRTQRELRSETRTTGAGQMGGNNAFVALHEQIKEQCAQSTIQALREKQGQEFDHNFMHGQVVAHMAMLDTLKVAQQRADGQLQQVLQQGQQTTQQHLEEAKRILEQIENQRQQRR